MKRNKFKYPFITSFAIVLLFSTISVAQKIDLINYKTRFNFSTVKQNDNSRILEVSFIAINKKNRKDKIPIYNAEIKFFNVLYEEEELLGSVNTTNEGIAQLIIPENQIYLTDGDGNIHLNALFEGTNALDEETEEILIKDIHVELNLKEIDSIRTVQVSAFTLNKFGEKILVEDVEINFYVQGMLSKMLIEEGFISNGEYEFQFPTDIPGDVNGNLLVHSMIVDHDEYWNVTKNKNVNWGVFHKNIVKEKNTLWSAVAPLWMYTVLTIMLVGVWANYVYTIINLFKIQKEGKKLELKNKPYSVNI
jgi:hypothetical protein